MSADGADFISGKMTTKTGWFRDQERFSLESAKDKETQAICSIRAKRLQGEKGSKPLSNWEKRNWVPVKVKIGEQGPHETIYLHIDSIAKNTGLTKKQIRETVKAAEASTVHSGFDPKTLEQLLKQAMKESTKLVDTVRSELFLTKTVEVICDSKGHVIDKTLCDVFLLSKEEVRLARSQGLFASTDIQHVQNDVHICKVTFTIASPTDKKLKQMVRSIHKLKREFVTEAMSSSPGRIKTFGIIEKEWKKISGLRAFVSPEGEIYLTSVSRIIGTGSFKTVWSGVKVSSHERVVITLPHKNKALALSEEESDEQYDKEREEMRLLTKAKGSGVCEFHTCFTMNFDNGIFSTGPRLGMILHYYNAGELSDNIEKFKQESLQQSVTSQVLIMHKLANALKRIHDKEVNIVHRDIKPENILLAKDDKGNVTDAVFIDFGLSNEYSLKTHFDTLKGTVEFLSPNQLIQGQGATFEDDIWALGLSFYEMLGKKFYSKRHELLANLTFNRLSLREEAELYKMYGTLDKKVIINRLRKDLRTDFEDQFNIARPDDLSFGPEEQYQMVQNQMEILCWDMLFSQPKMTAAKVAERMDIIEKKLRAVTSPEVEPFYDEEHVPPDKELPSSLDDNDVEI